MVTIAILVLLAIAVVPIQANAASTLRVDPDALNRLDELQNPETAAVGANSAMEATVGTNVEISVEHFLDQGKIISHTEPSNAISATNPLNVVVGYHDRFPVFSSFVCSISVSTDGGGSYTYAGFTPLTRGSDFCSDSALAAHPDGSFYFAYLSVRNSCATSNNLPESCTSDVVVARLVDGGTRVDFSSVAEQGDGKVNFPDKEYIAVDNGGSSPFRGTIYVTWTDFLNPNNPSALDDGQIKIVKSTDGGHHWSTPKALSPDALFPRAISGSNPVVSPDGTLYVFYADFTSDTGPLSIKFVKSTDGGDKFSAPKDVATGLPSPGRFRLKNADPNFGTVPGRGFRSNSFPSAAVAPDGTVSVVWVDFPQGSCKADGTGRPPCTNADVRYSRSTNGGKSWSNPMKISDDTGSNDQFFPWIAVQPDGRLNVIFGDKRLDSSNVKFDVFYTGSVTGGTTFTANTRVTTASSNPGFSTFIGDYYNLAATSGSLQAAWDDRRLGNNDIFGAAITT